MQASLFFVEAGTARTSEDTGDSLSPELVPVNKFCCLGEMLSIDADADVTVDVEARIQKGLNKFQHLSPLLTYDDFLFLCTEIIVCKVAC